MEITMTEDDFLTRWSRRKQEVAKAEGEPRVDPKPVLKEPQTDATQKVEPEFDVASLPPIESINALTDITAFLRAGVPAELTRAALRRVWTADPAIRDFVGLAENAWDFTDPAAMPGFGPLESTDDVRRMVASIVDKIGDSAEASARDLAQSSSDSKEVSECGADDQSARGAAAASLVDESGHEPSESQVLLQSSKVDVATQHDLKEGEEEVSKSLRRSHGGALPR
jgi:hypothetical protein